jgi:hypothetical protein
MMHLLTTKTLANLGITDEEPCGPPSSEQVSLGVLSSRRFNHALSISLQLRTQLLVDCSRDNQTHLRSNTKAYLPISPPL